MMQKCRARRYKYLETSCLKRLRTLAREVENWWRWEQLYRVDQVGFGFSFTFTTDASFAALSLLSANIAPTA